MKSKTGKEGTPIPGYVVKLVTAMGFWGSVLLRSSEELCSCPSGLSAWRTEDKLTNSHLPLVRGRPAGGWLSLISSSTHTAYTVMGRPHRGIRQILGRAARHTQ